MANANEFTGRFSLASLLKRFKIQKITKENASLSKYPVLNFPKFPTAQSREIQSRKIKHFPGISRSRDSRSQTLPAKSLYPPFLASEKFPLWPDKGTTVIVKCSR